MSKAHYRLKKRLYRLKAYRRKGFGVHSPFTFRLITNVIEPKLYFSVFPELKKFRKQILADLKKEIKSVNLSKEERVSLKVDRKTIKKRGKIDQLIFRLMNSKKAKCSLYLGDDFSLTAAYMAKFDSRNPVFQIGDISHELQQQFIFQTLSISNIIQKSISEIKNSDFVVISDRCSVDLLLKFRENYEQYLCKECYVVFVDMHKHKGMFETWELLKNSPFFSVSIDLFHVGILVARAGMQKQNYVRKYRF